MSSANSPSEVDQWLVDRRARVHSLLLRLWCYIDEKSDELNTRELERSLVGHFVGAAFSLWRAAFLMTPSKEWPKTIEDMKSLLRRLVQDNAISYENEKSFKVWSGTFYLNNAKYRLMRVKAKFQETKAFVTALEDARFKSFATLECAGAIDSSNTQREHWDILIETLVFSFETLTKMALTKTD